MSDALPVPVRALCPGGCRHAYPIVHGWCPMGCGQRLILHGTDIRCADPACPRPSAAAELLDDRETGHVVTLAGTGFTIRHPLAERLDDQLMNCRLHAYLSRHPAPWPPGRYRVWAPGAYQVTDVVAEVLNWQELP